MSATDELRRILDERGVKWWWEAWNKDLTIFDGAHGVRYRADHTLGEWFIMSVLPITAEQVIAATLGEPVDADLRKALDFMRIWISEDAHLGESAISYKFEKAEGLRKLDTIEDAIAATLGDAYTREECEASFVHGYSLGTLPVGSDPQWDENRQTIDEHMAELGWVRERTCRNLDHDPCWFECSECKCTCSVDYWGGGLGIPNYCPNCGAKVER